MGSFIKERLAHFREKMEAEGFEACLVSIEENRHYLSGFTGADGQFDETAGMLIITAAKAILVTDGRYETQAQNETSGFEVVRYPKNIFETVVALLKELPAKQLAIEQERFSVEQHQRLLQSVKDADVTIEIIAAESVATQLRLYKDETELAQTLEAIDTAEKAFKSVLSEIKPGMTEKALAWRMEQCMREAGADGLSFPVIVAAGSNSALPHAIPSDRPVKVGEPILFDWGARKSGYCSDTSRTVILGVADQQFKDVYATVQEAQAMAQAAMAPGVSCKEVDRIARDHIEAKGYGDFFGHGLGHGTGLAIHEAPRLSPISEAVLAPGMICTVEPGIYLPEWGGVRLENQVVVTDSGIDQLTRLSLGEYVVEA